MMQLLRAGGLSLQTGGRRAADEDNPAGYFEWEAIRTLPKNPRILDHARGCVIKVISLLLPALPRHHRYKIIFMRRRIEEVAVSQLRMLQRRVPAKTQAAPDRLAESLRAHRDEILALLRRSRTSNCFPWTMAISCAIPAHGCRGWLPFSGNAGRLRRKKWPPLCSRRYTGSAPVEWAFPTAMLAGDLPYHCSE
ncbi:MAG TPA: hypothetical protein VG710_02565 [Opitutus sp.]|nr:hypothetical protein [Opitutus sp.]